MIRRRWARMLEVMLGLGYAVYGAGLVPVLAGGLLVAAALVGLRVRSPRPRWITMGVGVFLVAWNWAAHPRPGPPEAQVGILVGLLVALFAVVPDDSLSPPEGWRPHVDSPELPTR